MSSPYQGFPMYDNGRLQVLQVLTPTLPPGAFYFRGIAVASDGRLVVHVDDGAYPRLWNTGVALHDPTGITLISPSAVGTNITHGGLLVDARGAVVVNT